jgi:hypothetical protein
MKRSLIAALAEISVISWNEPRIDQSDAPGVASEEPIPAKTTSFYYESVELPLVESIKRGTTRESVAETRMRLRKLSPRTRKALQKYVLNATEQNAKTRARLRSLSRRTRRALRRHLVRAAEFGDDRASTLTSPPTLDALRATLVVESRHQTPQRRARWFDGVTGRDATRQDS